jgi:hypothetical protein
MSRPSGRRSCEALLMPMLDEYKVVVVEGPEELFVGSGSA